MQACGEPSGALTMVCAWPVVGWGVGIHKRRAQKRESQSPQNIFKGLHKVIVHEFNLIEPEFKLIELENGEIFRSSASKFLSSAKRRSQHLKYQQREILRFELSNLGIGTPGPSSDDDHTWYDFVANLVTWN